MMFATYLEELKDLRHRRAYHITAVGGSLTVLFGVLDYIILPEYFQEFVGYRFAVAFFSLILLIANYLDSNKKKAALIGFTEYLLISFILLVMIYRMGGEDSHYYVGLIVAMSIYSTLASLTAVQSILSGLFIVCCYAFTVLLAEDPGFSIGVFNNLFFMICFVFIIATQSWAESKARRKEFLLRQQELEANRELSGHVVRLEEEVHRRTLLQAATEERYRLLFDRIADDVVVLMPDGVIIMSNQSFTNNFLADRVDNVTSFLQVVSNDDRITLTNLMTNALALGKPLRSCGLTLIRSDGSTCQTEINISLVERRGESLGILLVIRDIGTRCELEKRLFETLELKKQTENAAIMALAKLSEYRDFTPRNHLERIREYCRILALQLSRQREFMKTISPDFIQDIYHAAILHDIGKVSIPDALWEKCLPLTEQEEAKIRSHTLIGGNVIAQMEGEGRENSFLSMAKNIAYFHHERWDGKGYPYGLKKDQIPIEARIMAVADAYEELTSDCSLQERDCHEKATAEIMKAMKSRFDPKIAEALFLRQEEFRFISKKFAAV